MENTKCKSLKTLSRRDFLKMSYSCLIAGLSSSVPLSIGGCKSLSRDKPNIILITLDTTRADRLHCYGYTRWTSPSLDNLATKSVIYTRALAPSSWTLPSHASLFTGKFTSSHGARYDPEGPLNLSSAIANNPSWSQYRVRSISDKEKTLAEIVKSYGYNTGAVVAGPWLKKIFGLDKGFTYYDDSQIGSLNGRRASQVTSSALQWLKKVSKEKFFLFLNYFDPHYPYSPPEEFIYSFLPKGSLYPGKQLSVEEKNALYDAEILYMDYYIGHLFDNLKRLNLYDNMLLIITSDHGDLLGEHGIFGHGKFLFQEELHIPLIVKYPGTEISPKEEDGYIQLVDILPMILNRLNIPFPQDIQGNISPDIKHPIFAEVYPLPAMTPYGEWRALYQGNIKFLWNSKGNTMLFNLENDPAELDNLLPKDPDQAKSMALSMSEFLATLPKQRTSRPIQAIDEKTRESLKGLGYIK